MPAAQDHRDHVIDRRCVTAAPVTGPAVPGEHGRTQRRPARRRLPPRHGYTTHTPGSETPSFFRSPHSANADAFNGDMSAVTRRRSNANRSASGRGTAARIDSFSAAWPPSFTRRARTSVTNCHALAATSSGDNSCSHTAARRASSTPRARHRVGEHPAGIQLHVQPGALRDGIIR